MNDTEVFARTIYGEARGESRIGKAAVACVIMNRLKIAQAWKLTHGRPHPLFGDGSLGHVCQAPWQFSCWNDNDPNKAKLLAVPMADAIMALCRIVAQAALEGLPDLTLGATHYYAASLTTPPEWARGKTPVIQIGNHLFFNDVQ